MAEIKQNGKTFKISDEALARYKELIDLIIATESMDNEERQYWFDIMPSMTDEQIDRLYNILETERKELQKLEVRYQEEIKNLNEKHLLEWQEFQMKKAKQKVNQAKAKEKGEDKDPDEILEMLNDL
jgi:Na+/phosphate symporter